MTGPGGNELDTDDIETMFFGNQEAEALYLGRMLVWEAATGPYSDARLYFPFDNQEEPFESLGTSAVHITRTQGSGSYHQVDYISLDGSTMFEVGPTFNAGQDWTFALWIRTTQTGWVPFVNSRTAGTGTAINSWWMAFDGGDGNIYVGWRNNGNTVDAWGSLPPTRLNDGAWHHVVMQIARSGSTPIIRSWVDGVQRANVQGSPIPFNGNMNLPIHLGGDYGAPAFSGGMDDVAGWGRLLSSEEILELYQQGRSIVPLITTPSLSEMSINQYYYFTLGTNFTATSWSATGLPAGVSINNVGVISGTPTSTGSGSTTITASGEGGQTATKTFSWSVVDIPVLPSESIRTSGAKTSHSGWARPNVTWTVNSGSPNYSSNGTLNMRHGRGRVIASATLNSARQGRIVSNLNGVIAISSSSTGWEISTGSRVFQAGEQIHLELNGYSGSTSDRFGLFVEP